MCKPTSNANLLQDVKRDGGRCPAVAIQKEISKKKKKVYFKV